MAAARLQLVYLSNELIKVAQCRSDCWDTLQETKQNKSKNRMDVRAAQVNIRKQNVGLHNTG